MVLYSMVLFSRKMIELFSLFTLLSTTFFYYWCTSTIIVLYSKYRPLPVVTICQLLHKMLYMDDDSECIIYCLLVHHSGGASFRFV